VNNSAEEKSGDEKKESLYRIFRLSVQLLVFLLLVVLSTFLLKPLQRTMQIRMTDLRDILLARAEYYLNRHIEYGSMGPSLFGSLDIRNIRIYGDDAESVITLERFSLSYSIWELIRGNPLQSIHAIRIDRPVITLDWERDADLSALFMPSGDAVPEASRPWNDTLREIISLLPDKFQLRVRGGDCRVFARQNTFSVEGLNFTTFLENRRLFFEGRWTARADMAGLFNQPLGVLMTGRIDGEISGDLRRGSINLRIPSLTGDFFALRTLTVNMTLTERSVEIRKINDRLPFDFSLVYAFGPGELSASFRAEDFSFRDLLSFTGSWKQYDPYLAIRSSGSASLSGSPGRGVSYGFDLSGSLAETPSLGAVSFALAGAGDEKRLGFDRCFFQLPPGNLGFSGSLGLSPLALNGTIHIADFTLTGEQEINGDFSINASERAVNLFGENISLGPVLLSALNGNVIREENGFSFDLSALRFRDIESYEDVRLSTLSLEGSFDEEPRRLQGSLALDSFSVSDILDILRPLVPLAALPDMAALITNNISVTAEVFLTTDFKHILYNAPRLVAAYGGTQDIFTLVSVSGTDKRFELSEGRIIWANGDAEASGLVDLSDFDDIVFSFQTAYNDLFYYWDGEILDRRSLSVHGSYGFQGYAIATDYGGYSGYIETSMMPVPFGGQFARLSLLVSFRYDNPAVWSMNVDRFEVQDLSVSFSALTALRFSGVVNQSGLRFQRILFDDGRGVLVGRASAVWEPGFINPSGSFFLGDQRGTEICRIEGGYRDGYLDATFSGTDLQLGRFFRNAYDTVFSGEGKLHWRSMESYSINVDLTALSAKVGDTDIEVSGTAVLDDQELTLQQVQIQFGEIQGEVALFRVDRHQSLVSSKARVHGTALGRNLDMTFSTKLDFTPIDSWFDIQRAIESFKGVLYVQNIQMDTFQTREPFEFAFSRLASELSLSGGPGDMIRMQVSDQGDFYAAFSNPAPFRGAIIGSITPTTIEAQSSNLYIDLSSLWRFIPGKEIVNVVGGFVEATIQIKGSLGDPEFFGIAEVNSLRLQVPQFITADIEPVPIRVVLDGNEMSFGTTPTRVGNGEGTVSGWFRFDRWVPNVFNLDIQVPSKSPIPFGIDIAGIVAAGSVSGHLLIAMHDFVLAVTGDLTGYNAEIYLDSQQVSQQVSNTNESNKISVAADIKISTGPKVEFVYPTKDFPLVRAFTEVGSAIRITNDSLSKRYTVVGDVSLRSGEIFYFQRSFYIREGILSFNESDVHFDPQISARAETRDQTDEGPVTISLIIDSSPLISFMPRLESSPSLSQFEIFSLLGQSLTGAASEDPNDVYRSLGAAASDFLAQFYLVRRGERIIRDALRLDMFSIRTQLLQNMAFQAAGQQEPVDRISAVGNYFDNTTVFIGKYFGSDVFGQAMISFRYDENRTTFGELYQRGVTIGAGISLEGDFGFEIRGPLFDIQLNFVPRHLENMFLDDLSFTLSWKRSVWRLSDFWKEL
jgi:hypothetical protein